MATKPKTKEKVARFLTPVFRVSYPHLFKPTAMKDAPNAVPKYSVAALWTPSKFTDREKQLWSAILKALDAESMRAFKCSYKDLPKKKPNAKRGIRNGLEREGAEGYGEGVRFANLTSLAKPGVIDAKTGDDIGPDYGNAEEIYPGCYCQATVTVYSYNKGGGTGLALGLGNVRKIKDGPRLDNRVSAQDDFDEDVESSWLESDDDSFGDDDDAGGDDDDFN